jgi:hypothetical protein
MLNKKHWVKVLLSLWLIGMLSWRAACGAEIDWERLERGEPITWLEREGEFKGRAVGMILVDAPIENTWEILVDWGAKDEWAPMVEHYHIISEFDNYSLIAGRLRALFIRADFTLAVEIDKANKRQSWRQLTDDEVKKYREMGIDAVRANWTRNIEGNMELRPHGDKTLFIYRPVVESKLPVPERIKSFLMRLTLPDYLKALRSRAKVSPNFCSGAERTQ